MASIPGECCYPRRVSRARSCTACTRRLLASAPSHIGRPKVESGGPGLTAWAREFERNQRVGCAATLQHGVHGNCKDNEAAVGSPEMGDGQGSGQLFAEPPEGCVHVGHWPIRDECMSARQHVNTPASSSNAQTKQLHRSRFTVHGNSPPVRPQHRRIATGKQRDKGGCRGPRGVEGSKSYGERFISSGLLANAKQVEGHKRAGGRQASRVACPNRV